MLAKNNVHALGVARGQSVTSGPGINDGLTVRQEAFAQSVASGSTLSDAYRAAYTTDNMKPSTLWTEASATMRLPKITRRVEELVAVNDAAALHDAEERRRLVITGLMREAESADSAHARIRALELLGKTAGVDLFTTRTEQVKADRTVAEVEAELAKLLRKLNLSSD